MILLLTQFCFLRNAMLKKQRSVAKTERRALSAREMLSRFPSDRTERSAGFMIWSAIEVLLSARKTAYSFLPTEPSSRGQTIFLNAVMVTHRRAGFLNCERMPA